jgi:hypothetical protein
MSQKRIKSGSNKVVTQRSQDLRNTAYFFKKLNNVKEYMGEELKPEEVRTIKKYDEVMTPSSRQQRADIHRRKSHQNICKLNAINAL